MTSALSVFAQEKPLRLVYRGRTGKDEYGYVNAKGDTVIPMGRYSYCYTDRFDKMAIVLKEGTGIVAIDRKERVLFHVYIFDNGPDEPSEGLFRIQENGKIGYANTRGQIVIRPQYDGAYPFKGGKAKVGLGCTVKTDGEHSAWFGGRWFMIGRKGNALP